MSKVIVFKYVVENDEDVDSVINSIERDLASSDSYAQCLFFADIEDSEDME